MNSSKDEPMVISRGGSPILHHSEPLAFESPRGEECIQEISDHIKAHLGSIETVLHEIVSDTVHIDVHLVQPSEDFPFVRLVTSGMSDLPMTTPEAEDAPRFVELLMTLPGDWRLSPESFKDEVWYWPVRLLKELARLPHKHRTWLGFGHTVPNGNPAEPYASSTQFCCALILPPVTVPDDFHALRISESKQITFYSVVPLYREEMDLKLRVGSEELLARLERRVDDRVDLSRRNVAKKRWVFF